MADHSQSQAETAPQSGAVFLTDDADQQRRFGDNQELGVRVNAAKLRSAR